MVQFMFENRAHKWEQELKIGQRVPLFKKGDRNDKNNYRVHPRLAVHNAVNCAYTKEIVRHCLERRPWCVVVGGEYLELIEQGVEEGSALETLQVGDFENIRWELIMNRNQRIFFIRLPKFKFEKI